MFTLFPSGFSLHIPLTVNVMTGIFLALFIVWLIHMIITRYHWNNYGNDKLRLLRMNMYYFFGSALLFAALIAFLMAYSTSVLPS